MPASRTTADATPAPIRRELSFREFVVLGAWIGLLGGLGQVIMLAVTRFGLHELIQAEVYVTWAAPLSLGLLGTSLALPVAVLARTRIGRRWPALSLWVHSIQALTPR